MGLVGLSLFLIAVSFAVFWTAKLGLLLAEEFEKPLGDIPVVTHKLICPSSPEHIESHSESPTPRYIEAPTVADFEPEVSEAAPVPSYAPKSNRYPDEGDTNIPDDHPEPEPEPQHEPEPEPQPEPEPEPEQEPRQESPPETPIQPEKIGTSSESIDFMRMFQESLS